MQLPRGDRYNEAYKNYKSGNISEKEYEEFLSKVDGDSYVGAYYKSIHLHNDDIQAKIHIDRAISLFENRKQVINSAEDLMNDDGLVKHSFIATMYTRAAALHAKCNNDDEKNKALSLYQKSHYYLSQLDSGFNKIESGTVYSFRSVNRYALSDLIANSITVARPLQMNDPFDSVFTLWASKINLMKTCKEKYHIDPFSESFNSYRIRSFVGNKTLTMDDNLVNNIIMWSHYADAHKGYCIRYRLSKHFIKKPDDGTFKHNYLRKIRYVSDGENINIDCPIMDTEKLFTTKSNQWSNENEIRLVNYDTSHNRDFLQLKLDDCSAIEAIYFGYRCSDTDQRDIMSIVGDKAEYYRMEVNSHNVYSMIIKKTPFNPSNKSFTKNSSDESVSEAE